MQDSISLIKQLFHPLKRIHKLIRKTRLSEFWLSLWKKYGHGVLDQGQVEWIIKAKSDGKLCNQDIANSQGISVRRVQQLYSLYGKTGVTPQIGKPGRPNGPAITDEERKAILEEYERFKMCACYLENALASRGFKISHMRIHSVLKEEGLAVSEPHKHRTRKWVRYEREHSNSLWHTDWHEIKDPRWKGRWLIAYEDDSSRFITSFGYHETLTSQYSVMALESAIKEHGKPAAILSDHGSTFYAVESERREKGMTEFEKCLLKHKIRFILGRVNHPQTNGKIEKFFDIFEKKVKYFPSIEEFMRWYNEVRPHGALDLKRCLTPKQAFYERMADRDCLMNPGILEGDEIIS